MQRNLMLAAVSLPILFLSAKLMAQTPQRITLLHPPELTGWEEKIFQGHTQYETSLIDNKSSIKASSHDTASGLFKKIRVDLNKTPYLNWSWRIDNTLLNTAETTKAGDDYVARVYVIISGGVLFWKTRALNYVWSSNQAPGSHWPNAFSDNAIMLAVRSGNTLAKQWVNEKRNVLTDIQQFLGVQTTHIDAVAIMTDTDNSHQSAVAYYGNIYFSSD